MGYHYNPFNDPTISQANVALLVAAAPPITDLSQAMEDALLGPNPNMADSTTSFMRNWIDDDALWGSSNFRYQTGTGNFNAQMADILNVWVTVDC